MALQYIGKDPESGKDGSPTVFVDQDNGDLVVQGWIADGSTRTGCLESGPIPDHETVVRVPARMMAMVKEACDAAERADVH
ncbi:hypothetical protein [Streptomonospora salina]|uniref:Uncharacterized protein n=1 Tax=Streptomonospora salina TaxID=104205 RepID=A0A841EB14_9ACTN|nr:hypothetical protein [Streptomonospora salina]MBB5998253.1 hypothetical protein [Streptomonospora salina]